MDFDFSAIFDQILGVIQWIVSFFTGLFGGEGFDLSGLLGGE